MKNAIITLLALGGLLTMLNVGLASTDHTTTIIGTGACAKCQLKETKQCQLTVTAEENGKEVTYYIEPNDVAKRFGNQVCKEKKQLKVTGTAKMVDGKHVLVPEKIELAKE